MVVVTFCLFTESASYCSKQHYQQSRQSGKSFSTLCRCYKDSGHYLL